MEHIKPLFFPDKNKSTNDKQIPAYGVMRRLGHAFFFPVPLFSVHQSCEAEMLLIEHQIVVVFHSRLTRTERGVPKDENKKRRGGKLAPSNRLWREGDVEASNGPCG